MTTFDEELEKAADDFIELTVTGYKVLISKSDYDFVKTLNLVVHGGRKAKYVSFRYYANGVRMTKRLHRELMGEKPKSGMHIDHINGNTLDNRRCNLRVTEHYINARNQKLREFKKLPKNIHKQGNSFIVTFKARNKKSRETLYCKSFRHLAEAVIERDKWMRENNWHGIK